MFVGTAIELHGTSGNGGGSGTAIHFASGKKSWYVSNRYRMLRRKRLREEGRGGAGAGGGRKKIQLPSTASRATSAVRIFLKFEEHSSYKPNLK